jgi:hypothetical protein
MLKTSLIRTLLWFALFYRQQRSYVVDVVYYLDLFFLRLKELAIAEVDTPNDVQFQPMKARNLQQNSQPVVHGFAIHSFFDLPISVLCN